MLTSAQLGSYDTIKNNILVPDFGMREGFYLHFAASMCSGLITTTCANPVDVIKTRYMADFKGLYSSPLNCIVMTYKEAGVRAFFKGWMPSYWRLGMGCIHLIVCFMFHIYLYRLMILFIFFFVLVMCSSILFFLFLFFFLFIDFSCLFF